jgi:hypothetical protein
MSFSIFGPLFIFTFGTVIAFLGLTLDSIVAWVQSAWELICSVGWSGA